MTDFFRGTQDDVLHALGRRYIDPDHGDHATRQATWKAMCEIHEGAWLTKVSDCVFEVVETPPTVEQDVYGCDKGRACTNVAAALRPGFEALIKSKTIDSHSQDDRRFHWFWRIDRHVFDLSDVRAFVIETLGSPIVADAAEILVGNANAYTRHYEIDMHVTLLPDRMRIRVDDDGPRHGSSEVRSRPVLLEPGDDGVRPGGLAIIESEALYWSVIGTPEHGWSVWADFARSPDDTKLLAANFRTVPAEKIPARSYVYRGHETMAWVPVISVEISGGRVYPRAIDGFALPSFAVAEDVAIFAADAAIAP